MPIMKMQQARGKGGPWRDVGPSGNVVETFVRFVVINDLSSPVVTTVGMEIGAGKTKVTKTEQTAFKGRPALRKFDFGKGG